jgi:putative ATPase
MKDLGYGKGYRYPHSFKGALVEQDYLPEKLKGRTYYEPSDRGYEKEIGERVKSGKKKK